MEGGNETSVVGNALLGPHRLFYARYGRIKRKAKPLYLSRGDFSVPVQQIEDRENTCAAALFACARPLAE